MNKNGLKSKLKYTSLRDAHLHLIKLLTHQKSNQRIINKNLTHKEIMELINEYYIINNLQKPKLSIQSISNLKNRKLKFKRIERNKYSENFVSFIKHKFNEFNIELFFTISLDKVENKEINLSPNINIENKRLINIYNYWLLFSVLGVILLYYLYNVGDEISKDNLIFNNINEIKPTLIEEYREDYIDLQNENKELTTKNWIKSNKKIIIVGLTSLTIGITIGLTICCNFGIGIGHTNTINDVIITQEPGLVTPGTLFEREGLLILKAIDDNAKLENIN